MANNLNYGDGAKAFFIHHGEKVALGVCGLVLALFFMLGSTIDSLSDDHTPAKLAEASNLALNRIRSQSFEPLKAEREPATYDLKKKVEENLIPTDAGAYGPYWAWIDNPLVDRKRLRGDPAIFSPKNLVAKVIVGAIAVTPSALPKDESGEPIDPWAGLEPALIAVEKEPERGSRRGSKRGGNRDADEEDPTFALPEDNPLPVFGGNGLGGNVKTLPAAMRPLVRGVRPPANSVAMADNIVCVVATVDYDTQIREFEKVLGGARQYDEKRDRPRYLRYEAQVIDVTADPDMVVDYPEKASAEQKKAIDQLWSSSSEKVFMAKWGSAIASETMTADDIAADRKTFLVADTRTQSILASRWYGATVGELADPRYTLASLTSPSPPFLMTDFENVVVHPDIPTLAAMAAEPPEVDSDTKLFDFDNNPGVGAPFDAGEGVAPPGIGPGGPEVVLPGGMPGEMNAGAGIFGDGTDSGEEEGVNVATKMVRFFHLGAQPGHKYRYRVRTVLVDPNNAQGAPAGAHDQLAAGARQAQAAGQLSDKIMTSAVRQRLREVRDADEKYAAKYGETRKTYWRNSTWSSASAVVEVPEIADRFYAGGAQPPRLTKIGADKFYVKGEPSGSIVTSVWDSEKAVFVPGEMDANLGTLLNFKKDGDVLHPVDLGVRRIPDYQFKTDAIVVDIRGGEPLPGSSSDKPILSAGEFLLVDEKGNLFAQNELDDMDGYRWSLLIDDTPKQSDDMDTEPGDMYDDPDIVAPGIFPPGGARPPRGRRGRRNSDE